jgi:hypothetical protein
MSETKSSSRVTASGVAGAGRDDEFLDGYLCACQYLVIGHGEDTLAEYAMRESGYLEKDFLKAQKKNGFETRRMNRVIRNAFRNR